MRLRFGLKLSLRMRTGLLGEEDEDEDEDGQRS